MSRSSSNGAKGAVFLAFLLLAASPAGAQTPNPPGGSSGGGGTGCTTAGSNGDVLTDNGAGGCNSDGSATLTAGALGLGSSGVVGTVTLGNATSGTIKVQPQAGALGTVTLSLPAVTDTVAVLAAAQTLSGKSISGSTNTLTNIGNSSLTNSSVTIAGHSVSLGGTQALSSSDLSNSASIALSSNNLGFFAPTTSAQFFGVISDETGSGAVVGATSPSLVTPALGAATATTINKVTLTAPATGSTLTIADGKTLTDTSGVGAKLLLGATGGGFTGYAGVSCTNQFLTALSTAGASTCGSVLDADLSLTTPALGTPSAITLTNATGCAVSTCVGGLGSGVATFLGTPSSANLRTALTDESGTGAALFANGAIGTATGTSLALGGGAIGSDALEITGTSTFNGASNILAQLNVQNGTIGPSGGILIGADNAATTRTDATNKFGAIIGYPYTNAQNSIELLAYNSTTSANSALFCGGNSALQACTDIKFYTAAATNTAGSSAINVLHLDINQHIGVGGNTPAAGSCGTTPGTPVGNDNAFTIVAGATTGSCTVNFAKSYGTAPVCIAQDRSTVQALRYAISTSAITIIATSALGGDTLAVICQGN